LPRGKWRRATRDEAIEWYGVGQWYGENAERIAFIESLKPSAFYTGEHLSSQRYVAFEFERVVVAESSFEGNALYYVWKGEVDWQIILTLPKGEALKAGAKRIIHDADGTWKGRLRRLVDRQKKTSRRPSVSLSEDLFG
jgi:hypothetical protein